MHLSFLRFSFFMFLFVGLWKVPARANILSDSSLWMYKKFGNQSCQELLKNSSKAEICEAKDSNQKLETATLEIAEKQFFQNAADDYQKTLSCLQNRVGIFDKSEKLKTDAAQELQKKWSSLKDLYQAAARSYAELQRLNVRFNQLSSYCRMQPADKSASCYKNLETDKKALADLEQSWTASRSAYELLASSIWMGSSNGMLSAIEKSIQKNSNLSLEQAQAVISEGAKSVQKDLQQETEKLNSQSKVVGGKRVYDNLNDETKKLLVEKSFEQSNESSKLDQQDGGYTKLRCQLEGKYTKGREYLENAVLVSSFALAGSGFLMSKVPVLFRTGQFARLTAYSEKSASLLGALSVGVDSALVVNAVNKACENKISKNPEKNFCPSDENSEMQYQSVIKGQSECVLEAAIDMAPAGFIVKAEAAKRIKLLFAVKGPERFRAEHAEQVLGRNLSRIEKSTIEEAHRVGRGELGRDGVNYAAKDNYTDAQLKKKMRILQQLSLSEKERRALAEAGVVGDTAQEAKLFALDAKLDEMLEAGIRDRRKAIDSEEANKLKDEILEMLENPNLSAEQVAALEAKIANLQAGKAQSAVTSEISASNLFSPGMMASKTDQYYKKNFVVTAENGHQRSYNFEKSAWDDLSKADNMVKEKMSKALNEGLVPTLVNDDKVRLLKKHEAGAEGQLFEVRISGNGHQRLLGCYKSGVYTIKKYDPKAPSDVQAYAKQYGKLCH